MMPKPNKPKFNRQRLAKPKPRPKAEPKPVEIPEPLVQPDPPTPYDRQAWSHLPPQMRRLIRGW